MRADGPDKNDSNSVERESHLPDARELASFLGPDRTPQPQLSRP